jgi:hypothetical protein
MRSMTSPQSGGGHPGVVRRSLLPEMAGTQQLTRLLLRPRVRRQRRLLRRLRGVLRVTGASTHQVIVSS